MKVFALILGLTAALKPLKYSSLHSYSDFCSQISTFEAEYDHFSTRNTQKIEIRVITDDRFYQAGGPVLFYTGNEGSKSNFLYSLIFSKVIFNFSAKIPDLCEKRARNSTRSSFLWNIATTEKVSPMTRICTYLLSKRWPITRSILSILNLQVGATKQQYV